ncbi:hypothetical protein SERLA73DRAFT_191523 [Serpula lacrymans var. lacrymans S7.3]|uniref:Fatty acid desaturase domain-containing protein n=2 Tax=Serpula lacrymans var. lacrymans TaxID=341189 RepID=F8QHR3_SERL3|nr:uncharacterized protein SERLADRAFT_463891 [Serpula lacrymans var. lacrymans S7.9]EGN92175.1 hypothetical protein SERLA73DRAFT_191523 [Serpula lacrymans var. lacrymans S7.3]EGO26642.1 hypothetical protein SERLADRAFT_463891 [Serpula lacrymans var. lacrymans S7.9]
MSIFKDAPEYAQRKLTPFEPPKVTLAEIHASIPKHLYKKSTLKAMYYVCRDVFFTALFYKLATYIDPLSRTIVDQYGFSSRSAQVVKWTLWSTYWWWQGVAFAGWWCLGHEAGHGTLSQYNWINHSVGYALHTFLLVPYYSWRSTHHAHHKATGWLEKDENFVPRTRTDYKLPPASKAHVSDYHDIFEETPIYTLFRMLAMQLMGWQFYLFTNAMGSPMYPDGTNHFSPDSPLFKPHERRGIIASNFGLSVMSAVLSYYISNVGISTFIKFYFVPYLFANHWIVMLTYLHHSDPTIPHYRTKEWSFLRGAAATVDRPLLGYLGRFFLHNVSHDHVAHHFFSMIPFYNQPQVTEHVKSVLRENYNYDSTNTFRALYRTFTECCFIEDDGDIVFYKNKDGETQRKLVSETTGAAEHVVDKAITVTTDM